MRIMTIVKIKFVDPIQTLHLILCLIKLYIIRSRTRYMTFLQQFIYPYISQETNIINIFTIIMFYRKKTIHEVDNTVLLYIVIA